MVGLPSFWKRPKAHEPMVNHLPKPVRPLADQVRSNINKTLTALETRLDILNERIARDEKEKRDIEELLSTLSPFIPESEMAKDLDRELATWEPENAPSLPPHLLERQQHISPDDPVGVGQLGPIDRNPNDSWGTTTYKKNTPGAGSGGTDRAPTDHWNHRKPDAGTGKHLVDGER